MPSIRELIDQFLVENPQATENDYFDMNEVTYPFSNPEPIASNTEDVDLDDVNMEDPPENVTVEEAIQRLEILRRLTAETDSSSDSSSDFTSDSTSDLVIEIK